jgi:hypothetical protein
MAHNARYPILNSTSAGAPSWLARAPIDAERMTALGRFMGREGRRRWLRGPWYWEWAGRGEGGSLLGAHGGQAPSRWPGDGSCFMEARLCTGLEVGRRRDIISCRTSDIDS